MYFRLLVPERSRVESIRGGGPVPVTNPAVVDDEAGRTVIGAYLRVPPGQTTLEMHLDEPVCRRCGRDGGRVPAHDPAQPGLLAGPLALTISVPTGWHITAASPDLRVDGGRATLTTTLDRDVVIGLRYRP